MVEDSDILNNIERKLCDIEKRLDIALNKQGFLHDFFNSQTGAELGRGIGENFPELINSLSKVFGKERIEEVIDEYLKKNDIKE